jgi:hypothetical protein
LERADILAIKDLGQANNIWENHQDIFKIILEKMKRRVPGIGDKQGKRGVLIVENDKFQEAVLNTIGLLSKSITDMSKQLNGLEQNQIRMETDMSKQLNGLEQNQIRMETDMSKQLNGLEQNQIRMETDMSKQLNGIEQNQIRMENDMGEKLKALFDAHEVQLDRDKKLQQSIDDMAGKLNNLSFRVIPLEQVKAIKRKLNR